MQTQIKESSKHTEVFDLETFDFFQKLIDRCNVIRLFIIRGLNPQ